MGPAESSPFKKQLNNYRIIVKNEEHSMTYLSHIQTEKQYLLRELTFNDENIYARSLQSHKKRLSLSPDHLTHLIRVEGKQINHLCSNIFKVYAMWQYPYRFLSEEVHERGLHGRKFQQKQLWSIFASCIFGMSTLQQNKIRHECLTTKSILLDNDGMVKVCDPLSTSAQTNFDRVYNNRNISEKLANDQQTIYLSPQQCQSLDNRNSYSNPYKNDIFIMGMILLECGLLQKQHRCYKNQYQRIDSIILNQSLNSFGQQYGNQFKNILQLMLKKQEKDRPDWLDLKQYARKQDSTAAYNTQSDHKNKTIYSPLSKDDSPQHKQKISYVPKEQQVDKNPQEFILGNRQSSNQKGESTNYKKEYQSNNTQKQPVLYSSSPIKNYGTNSPNIPVQQKHYGPGQPLQFTNNIENRNYQPSHFQPSHYKPTQYQPSHYKPTQYQTSHYKPTQYQTSHYKPTQYQTSQYKPPQFQPIPYKSTQFQPIPYKSTQFQPLPYQPPTQPQPSLYQPPQYQSTNYQSLPQAPKHLVQSQVPHYTNFSNTNIQKINTTQPIVPKQVEDISYYQNSNNQSLFTDPKLLMMARGQPSKANYNSNIIQTKSYEFSHSGLPDNNNYSKKPNETTHTVFSQQFSSDPTTNNNQYQSNNGGYLFNRTKNPDFEQPTSGRNNAVKTSFQSNSIVEPALVASPIIQPTRDISVQNQILQNNNNRQNNGSQNNIQNQVKAEYVIETFKQGSRYEGYKLNQMRHGKGKFYYQDGGLYDGNWYFNKMDGFGSLYYQSGKLAYQGNWSNDQFQGFGKLFNEYPVDITQEGEQGYDYTDFDSIDDYWDHYQGSFEQDLKKGTGKLVLANDQWFQGNFNDDMVDGTGEFYCYDKKVVRGLWKDNHLVEQ